MENQAIKKFEGQIKKELIRKEESKAMRFSKKGVFFKDSNKIESLIQKHPFETL